MGANTVELVCGCVGVNAVEVVCGCKHSGTGVRV